ncbi:copper resistance protein CopC [Virgibacillus necropolis]|uniref:copper resistance CopC family protein n=1 Tax=Virgibacillus necropolis TaxID=163877 RepID=UPI00384AD557
MKGRLYFIRNSYFLLIALLLFSILAINEANAHSVLEEAKPKAGEQLTETINSIELTFSTKIENGSTLYLVDDKGKEIEPTSVELTDDVLEANFQDSLEPGSYRVNWKVVGADGHLIENQYSFSIAVSENKGPEDNTTQTEDDEIETEQRNKDAEQQKSSNKQTKIDNERTSLVSGIIIFLIIAGLVLLCWMLFSKRQK